jgi:hypothetical protein
VDCLTEAKSLGPLFSTPPEQILSIHRVGGLEATQLPYGLLNYLLQLTPLFSLINNLCRFISSSPTEKGTCISFQQIKSNWRSLQSKGTKCSIPQPPLDWVYAASFFQKEKQIGNWLGICLVLLYSGHAKNYSIDRLILNSSKSSYFLCRTVMAFNIERTFAIPFPRPWDLGQGPAKQQQPWVPFSHAILLEWTKQDNMFTLPSSQRQGIDGSESMRWHSGCSAGWNSSKSSYFGSFDCSRKSLEALTNSDCRFCTSTSRML